MKHQPGGADGHRRTRRDHSTETAEDYVEAIAGIIASKGHCRVVDLAKQFAVTHVTVSRIVSRLQKEGFVLTLPYQPIELTEKGQQLAKASRERHEIVYRFLISIGVPETIAAVDSEGIEHHVSPETLACFRNHIEQRCPHPLNA